MPNGVVVAIVDEDPSCREIAVVMLAGAGIRTHVFETAVEFFAWVKVTPCDCVLAGAEPLEITAGQFQEALKGMGRRVPVIFMLAEPDLAHANALLAGGAVDVLAKPIDPAWLLSRVRGAMAVKAA